MEGTLARAGVLRTPHGEVRTPAFVPVGTAATVKSLAPEELRALGAQIVLCNTYHLYLRPGEKTIARAGGLAGFMAWDGPTMTDSGGFQVFSLGFEKGRKGITKVLREADASHGENGMPSPHARLVKVDEDGVTFASHIDGTPHRFTPEKSIAIQEDIGADIIFAFDECTSPLLPREKMKASLARTHAWAKRSRAAKKRADQALFGIVQGGRYADLREESARFIAGLDFDGFGIGGSFDKEDMTGIVALVNGILPEEKPRHMLGIGEIEDMFEGIERGIDLFDCVMPTRLGRNGSMLTRFGRYDIFARNNTTRFEPPEEGCACYTCLHYTRAYLHHLFKAKELLGYRLATIHNLFFTVRLVDSIRGSILEGNFFEHKTRFFADYRSRHVS